MIKQEWQHGDSKKLYLLTPNIKTIVPNDKFSDQLKLLNDYQPKKNEENIRNKIYGTFHTRKNTLQNDNLQNIQ